MTLFLFLIVMRGLYSVVFTTWDFVDLTRDHLRPRGVTSLDRGELITRPMVLVFTARSRFTHDDDVTMTA